MNENNKDKQHFILSIKHFVVCKTSKMKGMPFNCVLTVVCPIVKLFDCLFFE